MAMDVDAGRRDEEFEVTLWTTRREAESWAKDAANANHPRDDNNRRKGMGWIVRSPA